jgi:hypothetical protein
MISLELCAQSLGAAISSLLDPKRELKPEMNLFSFVEWGELQFSKIRRQTS